MTVYFTSDHHFGDARRLGIDRRPFGRRAFAGAIAMRMDIARAPT